MDIQSAVTKQMDVAIQNTVQNPEPKLESNHST